MKKEKFDNKNYYIKNDRYLTLTSEEYKNIEKEIILYEDNISDLVGVIKVKLNNEVIFKEYIYEKVIKKYNDKNISFWDKILKFFKLI